MKKYAVTIPRVAKNGVTIYGSDTTISEVNENGNFIETYDFARDKIVKSKSPYLNLGYGSSHNPKPMDIIQSWNGSIMHKTFDHQTQGIAWKSQAIEFVNIEVVNKIQKVLDNAKKKQYKIQKEIDKIKSQHPEYFI